MYDPRVSTTKGLAYSFSFNQGLISTEATCQFHSTFPRHPKLARIEVHNSPQVAYLFILSTLNSAFDMAMMYEPLIAGFGAYVLIEALQHSQVTP